MNPKVRITHIGTATVLLEIGKIRILTDPAFDPVGTQYNWAPVGASSTKLEAPALRPEELGELDAILITHAQHDDNFDRVGKTLFSKAQRVITTRQSAKKLGGKVEGLALWDTTEIAGHDDQRIRITATPARHGPPLSLPFVGKVIGFVLEWEGQTSGALYISGDTVLFGGIHEIADKFKIHLGLLHMGQAKLPITGPFRLTMNAQEAIQAARLLGIQAIVPIHYDGWTHFSQSVDRAKKTFMDSDLFSKVHWLTKGQPAEFEL